jgi:trk system potassium uptake protein TrkA
MSKNDKKRYLVIGLGRFGTQLAESLTDAGHDVIAVDVDMERIEAVKHRVAFAMQLDGTSTEALKAVDATSASTAVVAMGDNFEAAALCVVAVKELGVPRIFARARTPAQCKILAAVGATRTIELEAEMARSISTELAQSSG